MTDRLNAVIVVFDTPIRDDDAQPIIDAIRQLRGVLTVAPVVADGSGQAERMRTDVKWANLLGQVIRDGLDS